MAALQTAIGTPMEVNAYAMSASSGMTLLSNATKAMMVSETPWGITPPGPTFLLTVIFFMLMLFIFGLFQGNDCPTNGHWDANKNKCMCDANFHWDVTKNICGQDGAGKAGPMSWKLCVITMWDSAMNFLERYTSLASSLDSALCIMICNRWLPCKRP